MPECASHLQAQASAPLDNAQTWQDNLSIAVSAHCSAPPTSNEKDTCPNRRIRGDLACTSLLHDKVTILHLGVQRSLLKNLGLIGLQGYTFAGTSLYAI
jgi:hypothetical protein